MNEYSAQDMATAAAQGFRDGVASVKPAASVVPDTDELSNFIRQINGNNRMGACVLAERICDWFARLNPAHVEQSAMVVPAEYAFAAPAPAQTEQQPVEVMPFQFKHPDTGDAHAVALTRQEVADGMEDTLYEKLADLICHCEPVGETNVVDCNCDDYIYEFELVSAAPIAQAATVPEPASPWISVEERLPLELCATTTYETIDVLVSDGNTVREGRFGRGGAHVGAPWRAFDQIDTFSITHWMPLPAAPEQPAKEQGHE